MKRSALAAGAAVLLWVALAQVPAGAQSCVPTEYVPCATTTTSTSSTTSTTTAPSTTTTVQATTTTTAPPPPQVNATTTNGTPKPGEAVPVVAPPTSGTTPAIDTTKPIAAVLVPTGNDLRTRTGNDVPAPKPVITSNPDGTQTLSVTVPPATPPGIYVLAIVGTAPNGSSRVIVVAVVVKRGTAQSRTLAADAAAPAEPAVAVPASVRKLAASIAQIGGEAAVEDAVLNQQAELRIDGQKLVLYRPDASSSDGSRPLVVAFAVALAGGGLVLLRRRTPAISKRSS